MKNVRVWTVMSYDQYSGEPVSPESYNKIVKNLIEKLETVKIHNDLEIIQHPLVSVKVLSESNDVSSVDILDLSDLHL